MTVKIGTNDSGEGVAYDTSVWKMEEAACAIVESDMEDRIVEAEVLEKSGSIDDNETDEPETGA